MYTIPIRVYDRYINTFITIINLIGLKFILHKLFKSFFSYSNQHLNRFTYYTVSIYFEKLLAQNMLASYFSKNKMFIIGISCKIFLFFCFYVY